jgi:hypothetical protein
VQQHYGNEHNEQQASIHSDRSVIFHPFLLLVVLINFLKILSSCISITKNLGRFGEPPKDRIIRSVLELEQIAWFWMETIWRKRAAAYPKINEQIQCHHILLVRKIIPEKNNGRCGQTRRFGEK